MKAEARSKRAGGKANPAWLHDHLNDPYVKLARKEGYRARSAYKLKEIDEALGLIRPGLMVVDLGCAPGAWSQYLRRRMFPRSSEAADAPGGRPASRIVALDILPMEPVEGVTFIQGDFREDDVLQRLGEELGGRTVDVVVSDLAPNLSGIESSDAARVEHLIELAIEFSARHLAPGGALVAKVFHGSGYSQLVERFKRCFRAVKPFKPKASRDKSAETFLVGIGLRSVPARSGDR